MFITRLHISHRFHILSRSNEITNVLVSLRIFFFTYLVMIFNFKFLNWYYFHSMEGGELFQRIQDRQDEGPFTERGNK